MLRRKVRRFRLGLRVVGRMGARGCAWGRFCGSVAWGISIADGDCGFGFFGDSAFRVGCLTKRLNCADAEAVTKHPCGSFPKIPTPIFASSWDVCRCASLLCVLDSTPPGPGQVAVQALTAARPSGGNRRGLRTTMLMAWAETRRPCPANSGRRAELGSSVFI